MSIKTTLLLLSFLFITSKTSAVDMESPRFRIESGSIDLTAPEKTSSSKPAIKNTEADQFNSTGLIVKTDGQSTNSRPFRFIIEKSIFSMGNVSPNSPSMVSSTISITGGRSVYQIVGSESDLLRKLSGETIPDTNCSSGKKCTPSIAAIWESVSAYGFGYSLDGRDIPTDFIGKDYFRPFPNSKKNSQPTVLMKGTDKTDERHSTITLKTIVSAVQADGTYETTLNFMALPGY